MWFFCWKKKKKQYCSSFSLQTTPTAEEIGHCDEIRVSEIGGTSVTIFKQGTVWVTYCSAINVLAKTEFFLWLLLLNSVLPTNQSIINPSINQSINPSINQSVSQSVRPSVRPSVNQSINQSFINTRSAQALNGSFKSKKDTNTIIFNYRINSKTEASCMG